MVEKVTSVHVDRHPELYELREVFGELRTGLEEHTKKERTLFSACRESEEAEVPVWNRQEPDRGDDGRARGLGGRAADGS
jgi:iron-sulfur cluster repair protein YtfE (RIC family)